MHSYLMDTPRLVILLGMVLSFWEAISLLISSDIGLSHDVELDVELPGDWEPSATSSAAAESASARVLSEPWKGRRRRRR